ncbi:hypothetical protein [Methanolacinia paynteri]|uniref:hypothetical protein n=1 Tax=Methanolacinia paynteri TaxID=230356 RepID=UPI00064F30A3|nr:hypothetical protein [Methanolacinia paynteri]
MNPEQEIIRLDDDGSLRIEAGGPDLFIAEDDVESLVSSGRVVPVFKSVPGKEDALSIEGHAAISPGGKAVKIFTTAGHFIIPFVSLQRVAKEEAVSAPLFPLEPDLPEERS